MRSFLHLRWLLTLLLGLGALRSAQASHIRGGDVSYASTAPTTAGVPRYHVVVRQFVEPVTNGLITTTVPLVASRGCGATGTNTFTVTAPRTQLLDATTLTCGSTGPLYQVAVYEADLDLPAGQWLLSVTLNARTTSLLNLLNAPTQNCYLVAYLDNTLTTQDVSPVFQSLRQPYLNVAAFTPHNLSAFDANGDSLRYEIIQPLGACNQPLVAYPSTFVPHFAVDASTGLLTPTVAGISTIGGSYNITVKVSEYRRINGSWQLIGYVIRDTLYIPLPAINQPPTFTTARVNGGAAQPVGLPIVVQPGQLVSVVLQATDPDAGQLLRFVGPAAGVVPGLSLAAGTMPGSAQLTWQVPASLPAGRYPILATVLDDGCIYNATEERTLTFVVGGNAPLATRAGLNAATEVYPTPFREQVQFKTVPNQVVVLFDALGREVARLTSAPDGLVRWQPASALPAGLYLARSAADGQPLARLLRAE
ncbi:MAG: hypothetical protein ACRYFZ_01515 [Janthinobacterium lividum]